MSEAEWLTGNRSVPMLLSIRDTADERKVLLFNCACCRRIWSHLGRADQMAVNDVERVVDDPAAIREWQSRIEPERRADLAIHGLADEPVSDDMRALLTNQTTIRLRLGGTQGWGIGSLAFYVAKLIAEALPENGRRAAAAAEEREQAELVREVFGNPFRPVTFDPTWRTSTAIALAQQMYESRDFSLMPILADALQDVGCDNPDILDHCLGSGPHVRGCWVVDLILGKS